MIDEIILPRDNVFIWLGSFDNSQVNNVLILAGGEVLILKAIRKFDLNQDQIRNDLEEETIDAFIEKYDLIDDISIITEFVVDLKNNKEDYKRKIKRIVKDLKEGVKNKKYPPFTGVLQNLYLNDFYQLTRQYLSKFCKSPSSEQLIKDLMKIRDECEGKIQEIYKTQLKEEEAKINKLKKTIVTSNFNKLLEIKKEIDKMVDNLQNKIHSALGFVEKYKELL